MIVLNLVEVFLIATPKNIVISSLAMRFYECDGWTYGLLQKYLIRGDFFRKPSFDVEGFYYILDPEESSLDIDSLIKDGHVGELIWKERWPDLIGLSDLQILKGRNG